MLTGQAPTSSGASNADFEKILETCISVDEYDKFIYPTQVHRLNDKPLNDDGIYVLYWCQGSPRNHNNLALEYAIQKANDHALGLIVCTGALIGYPLASERHAAFMLEGLQEFKQELGINYKRINICTRVEILNFLAYDRGVRLFVGNNSPDKVVTQLAKYAVEVIVDMNYLRVQRQWYEIVSNEIQCLLTQIENNSCVPVGVTSDVEESDFDVFKQKLYQQMDAYAKPVLKIVAEHSSLEMLIPADVDVNELNIFEIDHALETLNLDRTVKRVDDYSGGYCSALSALTSFVNQHLPSFDSLNRDNPGHDITSRLSGYLNFGHISCVEILLAVKNSDASDRAKENFLDRVFVQRELAINAAWYNQQYDSLLGSGLPAWALHSIKKHASDHRPYMYSLKTLESAETDDPLWNAAQLEMVHTARMHTFMRLYWGKKVMEWTPDMDTAFNYLVYLNDKYEMDGRDPCSYAGIGNCFGKFAKPSRSEIAVFGTIEDLHVADIRNVYGSDVDLYIDRCYKIAGRCPPTSQK